MENDFVLTENAMLRRFATEFYCGVKLEELASRHRLKALVEKLHHTKQRIQDR